MDADLLIEMLKNNRGLWVTATVTGGFALLVSVLNAIGLYFQRRKQLEYDKKLESYKSVLDNRNYVSKVRFDAEFLLYRELMVACRNMINDVYFVYPTFANVPASEDERKKYEDDVFISARTSYNEFNKLITSNAPFIPKDFYERFLELMKLCNKNLTTFSGRWNVFTKTWWFGSKEKSGAESEAYKRTHEINKTFESLVDDIRGYLSTLDVGIGGSQNG